jgi:hypothetical protein
VADAEGDGDGSVGVGTGAVAAGTPSGRAPRGAGTGRAAAGTGTGLAGATGCSDGLAGGTATAAPTRAGPDGGDSTITGSPVEAPRGGVPPECRSPTHAAPTARTISVGTVASATSMPTINAYLRVGPATP